MCVNYNKIQNFEFDFRFYNADHDKHCVCIYFLQVSVQENAEPSPIKFRRLTFKTIRYTAVSQKSNYYCGRKHAVVNKLTDVLVCCYGILLLSTLTCMMYLYMRSHTNIEEI